jgi:outer membrane protein TolC
LALASLVRAEPEPTEPGLAPATARLSLSLSKTGVADREEGARVGLKDFAAMVAASDEMVRAQRLEESIADEGIRGATSIFEPVFFMSTEREGMTLLNSAQDAQRRGQLPGDVFWSQENRIKTGLSMKSSVGTDLELSYNVSELRDSIQLTRLPAATVPEYKGYLGLKLTQPLLRGAGQDATMAGIALAETEKRVARETVRQVLTQRVMDGLTAYLTVQRAQARVMYRTLALATAADIEQEMAQQQVAGLRTASDLTEARASLALRKAQLAQAQQDREEQVNALQVFVSAPGGAELAGQARVLPQERLNYVGQVPTMPMAKPATAEASAATQDADPLAEIMARRPEARVSAIRIDREKLKFETAREQSRPELNFTLRMGKESLDGSARPLGDYLSPAVPYDSWQVGLMFRIGINGDERKRSELQTAAYRQQQAELAQEALRQRIGNEARAAATLIDKAEEQMLRQRDIVAAQRQLAEVERQLVNEGRRSMLDVRKKQLELYMAEEALADATAFANRVYYLSAQVDGRLLARLGIE